MLLSSRSLAYAHALKNALSGKRGITPQAATLGLTPEAGLKTLNDLHSLYVAEGVATVGRKMIAQSLSAAAQPLESACLGYLYGVQFPDERGELPVVRTLGSARLRLEPKLVLRFANEPDLASGFDAFMESIDAIAMGAELLLLPFENKNWVFEDKLCANGFSKAIMVGELKTLSRRSKKNFSLLLDHSTFSLSRNNAVGSVLLDHAPGHSTSLSSIAELYQLLLQRYEKSASTTITTSGLVALNAVCQAHPVLAGDEWVCVSTGLDLPSLRIRFG